MPVMEAAFIAITVLSAWGPNQDPPLPTSSEALVRTTPNPATFQPDSEEFTSVHTCANDTARITVRRTAQPWTEGSIGKLEVVAYSDDSGPASPRELARWNAWLGEIPWWGGYRVYCAFAWEVGGFAVSFSDAPPTNHGSVTVTWLNGHLYRQPQTEDQYQLLEQWNSEAENDD